MLRLQEKKSREAFYPITLAEGEKHLQVNNYFPRYLNI